MGCRSLLLVVLLSLFSSRAADVLVEAEAFADYGGWVLDPQFLDAMGSPYLLAHGLGKPVANAVTKVEFPTAGTYRLWVRTKDWVPSHHPGRFRIAVDGQEVSMTFGDRGQDWLWQDGGMVSIRSPQVKLELVDLTGFDGRCDALLFCADAGAVPPAIPDQGMAAWRRRLLGLADIPPSAGEFDVVVVGGGLAGCAAALAAARLGLQVALVQNRPLLGGNASPEIGITPRGETGAVVGELVGPGRDAVIRAEPRIRLYLDHHVFRAQRQGDRIESVDARHTASSHETRFQAPLFIDCTGTGAVGFLAGAEYRLGREAQAEFGESLAPVQADTQHHGNTVPFAARLAAEPVPFPDVPWAMAVSRDYADLGGQVTQDHDNEGGLTHFWEYGQRLDPFRDAEEIRDHLFQAIYGTFATAKRLHPEAYANLELARVGPVPAGGESRRLVGDYLLTEGDVRSGTLFPDAVALCSGHFCLHFPGDAYDFRLGDWKFIPVPTFSIPLRCLYSRNVANLLMAGKHISVTHIAGSATKTMLTGGQTGVATGAAAFLCRKYATTPREVGRQHLRELQAILLAQSPYQDSLRPRRVGEPPFPRLANCYAAQLTPDSTEKDIEEIARYDLLIGGVWCNGADPEHRRRLAANLAAVRQRNPRIVILDFSSSAPYHDAKDANFPANGWLLQPDGRRISGWPGTEMTNLTHTEVLDFLAERSLASLRDRGFDGSFVDCMGSGFDTWACNIEHHEPYQVDADRDGQTDPRGQLDAAWTTAKTDLSRRIRERIGSTPVFMANAAGDWGAPYLNGILLEDYLDQVLDAGADWEWAFGEYQRWCRQARQPNVTTLVSSSGVEPPYDAWRTLAPAAREELLEKGRTRLDRMRFGLTTTLMDDGYFAYDLHTRWRGQRWWYPEYDVPLGYPRAPAVRQEDGTWRRDFDGGTVIVNPTPLDAVVSLAGRHRDASSDRVATRFLVPGHDGRILLPCVEAERLGTWPEPHPPLTFAGPEPIVERDGRVLVRLPGLAGLFDAQGRLLMLTDGRRTLAENLQTVLVTDEAWRNFGYAECSHRVTGPGSVEFSGRRSEGAVTVAYVARVEVGQSGVEVAYRFELLTDARFHNARLQCDFPASVFADGTFRSGATVGRLPRDRAPQPVLAERLREVSLTAGAGAPVVVNVSGDAVLVDERHYGVNGYRLGYAPASGEMKAGTVWDCAIRIGRPSPQP